MASNPLENFVVLKHLTSLLPLDQLTTFRLVSRLWCDASLERWRATTKVTLTPGFRPEEDTRLKESRNFIDRTTQVNSRLLLNDFVEFVENPGNQCEAHPFRRFVINNCSMGIGDGYRFWTACGPHMTELVVSKSPLYSIQSCLNLVRKFCPSLRQFTTSTCEGTKLLCRPETIQANVVIHGNLKRLEIDIRAEKRLSVKWLETLVYFPKLEDLRVNCVNQNEILEKLFSVVLEAREQDKKSLVLKHLSVVRPKSRGVPLTHSITEDLCLRFREVELPLETLCVDFGLETSHEIVFDILQTHKKTLKKIDISGSMSPPSTTFCHGNSFESLQDLTMPAGMSKDMTFLKWVPNLRRLELDEEFPPPFHQYFVNIVRNTPDEMDSCKMEKLEDLDFGYPLRLEDLRKLMKWMPHVTKLRMFLNNEMFREVCATWTELEKLEVLGRDLDNYGVTGLTTFEAESAHQSELGGGDAVLPNITNLTHLHTFIMKFDRIFSSRVMDTSVYKGFLLLPNLRNLTLFGKVSHAAWAALTEKLEHCFCPNKLQGDASFTIQVLYSDPE